MKKVFFILVGLFFTFLSTQAAFSQKDEKGCQDHPLLTRMPNFYIRECKVSDFNQAEFLDEKGKEIKVEGKYYEASYRIREGQRPPSELQILRNYENAVRQVGGVLVREDPRGYAYLKLDKAGKTFWIVVNSGNGSWYRLTVVEKAEMAQEVVADAKSLWSDLKASGHASIYGIYFDFNKAEVKPDSEPAIREIAKLLAQNSGLKLYVVGHTDNVGGLDYNLKLSKARADAVVKELTTKHKIAADRLKAYGIGSLAPVASNENEEGRAKNRRVELVKP